MQNLHRNWISVSRLCCPVCWELMKTLGGSQDTDPFEVRGRHSVVYDMELPNLLPTDILEKMIRRFKEFVYQELISLTRKSVDSADPSHSRNTSFQSDSGISIQSMTTVDADAVREAVRERVDFVNPK